MIKSLDFLGYPDYTIDLNGVIFNTKLRIYIHHQIDKRKPYCPEYVVIKMVNGIVVRNTINYLVGEAFWMEDNIDSSPYKEAILLAKEFYSYKPNEIKKIQEIYSLVKGYYYVTNDGTVWNERPKRKLSLHKNRCGYITVHITDLAVRQRGYFLHRLVAKAFCPRPEHLKDIPYEELQVNHIDGNKENNHYTNLEWCTCQENIDHAIDLKLRNPHSHYSDQILHQIGQMLQNKIPDIEISRQLNIPTSSIATLKALRTKSAAPIISIYDFDIKPYTSSSTIKCIYEDYYKNNLTKKELQEKYHISYDNLKHALNGHHFKVIHDFYYNRYRIPPKQTYEGKAYRIHIDYLNGKSIEELISKYNKTKYVIQEILNGKRFENIYLDIQENKEEILSRNLDTSI